MKIGFRKPSLKGMISARTSPSRFIRHSLGFKAPRGWGWLTNPKKAAYNRIYNRTTFGFGDVFGGGGKRSKSSPIGCGAALALFFVVGLLGRIDRPEGMIAVAILAVVGSVIYFVSIKKQQELKENTLAEAEEFEVAQRARIISESVEIINNSNNYKTRISRLEVVVSHLEELLRKYPHRIDLKPELEKALAHREAIYTGAVEEKVEKHMATARERKTAKAKVNAANLAMQSVKEGMLSPHTDKLKLQHFQSTIQEYIQHTKQS